MSKKGSISYSYLTSITAFFTSFLTYYYTVTSPTWNTSRLFQIHNTPCSAIATVNCVASILNFIINKVTDVAYKSPLFYFCTYCIHASSVPKVKKKSVLVDIMGTFCSLLQLSGKMLLSCNSSSSSKSSISNNSSLSSLFVEIKASSKFEFSSVYKRIFLFHHQNGQK